MASIDDVLKLMNGTMEERITVIIKNTEKQLLNKLYADVLDVNDTETIYSVPSYLEYIVTDVAMLRVGRLGSEGLKSESISGASVNYMLPAEDFDSYKKEISTFVYNNSNFSDNGSVMFF